MKKRITFIFLLLTGFVYGQKPDFDEIWANLYGGNNDENCVKVLEQEGGGSYYLIGTSKTYNNSGDLGHTNSYPHHGLGSTDVWVVRVLGNGTIDWEKSYGGNNYDHVTDALMLPDDQGIIIVGYSRSNSGHFLNKNRGGEDLMAIKIALDGELVFAELYGGEGNDRAVSVCPGSDELRNVFIAGNTNSSGGDIRWSEFPYQPNSAWGGDDVWFLGINVTDNYPYGSRILAQTVYGGLQDDNVTAMVKRRGYKYEFSVFSMSTNGYSPLSQPGGGWISTIEFYYDMLNSSPNRYVIKFWGPRETDVGYIVEMIAQENGSDLIITEKSPFRISKLTPNGVAWRKTLPLNYNFNKVVEIPHGDGFYSLGTTPTISSGSIEYNLHKYSPSGNLDFTHKWSVDGYSYGRGSDMILTEEGQILLAGNSNGDEDNYSDPEEENNGGYDYFAMKIDVKTKVKDVCDETNVTLGGSFAFDPIPGGYKYDIRVVEMYNNYSFMTKTCNRCTTVTKSLFTFLQPNEWYEAEVRVDDGEWGERCSFRTSPAARMGRPTKNGVSALEVLVYPNPANKINGVNIGVANFSSELNRIAIRVYDLFGKEVYARDMVHGRDDLLTNLNTETLSSGIYMVNIHVNGEPFNQKLQVE